MCTIQSIKDAIRENCQSQCDMESTEIDQVLQTLPFSEQGPFCQPRHRRPYVPVPKDLNKVKTKVAFNLTKRQLVCFSGGALIGVPLFFLLRGPAGNSVAAMCTATFWTLMRWSGKTTIIT